MKSETSLKTKDSPNSTSQWRSDLQAPTTTAPEKLPREIYGNLRVVQRNLVYLISLSPGLADESKLLRTEYLGQYGPIKKCVVNTATAYSHSAGPSYSAYITFHADEDAAKCIKAINGFVIDGRELNATYGTTKYCAYFLKAVKCPKAECLYLHKLGAPEDTLDRDGTAQLKDARPHFLQFCSIEIDPPDGTRSVFPSARLVRTRNFSEDNFRQPERVVRRLSLATPNRTRSRFEFVQAHSEEKPAEVPEFISELISLNSPYTKTRQITVKDMSSLLAPDSPDSWIGEIFQKEVHEVVRRLSLDDLGAEKTVL